MRNKNTTDMVIYLFKNVLWSIVSMTWYRSLTFRCLPDETLNYSKRVLWIMLIGSVLVGIVLTYKRRRNNVSVFVNIGFSYGVYSLFCYRNIYPRICVAICIVCFMLSVAYAAIVFSRKIKNKAKIKRILWLRTKGSFLGMRTIIATILIISIMPITCSAMFGNTIVPKRADTIINDNNDYTIKNNMDTMPKLLPENFEKLTVPQKLTVLQILANVEANYLGIGFELNVIASNLDVGVLGSYDHKLHTISIDAGHLATSSSEDLIRTICHESYHAYERSLVEMYNSVDSKYKNLLMFYEIPYYENNFSDYIDGDESMLGYWLMDVEVDARNYADRSVDQIYETITGYLESENK